MTTCTSIWYPMRNEWILTVNSIVLITNIRAMNILDSVILYQRNCIEKRSKRINIENKIKNRVKELYILGYDVSDISKELDISNRTISRYLISINTPCDYCGEIHNNRCYKNTRVFCNRHYLQMTNYNKCFKSIFDKNEYEKCNNYYKMYFSNDKNNYALISDSSFTKVQQYKWHIRPDGYVESKYKNESILLHRLVTDFIV